MALITEKFFRLRLLNSKISILFATIFSVVMMGTLCTISINYASIEKIVKESVSFNLIVEQDVKELELQQLIKSLILVDGVKSVNYISKASSANNLSKTIGQEFLEVLGDNPLNDIIEVAFISSYINPLNTDLIKNMLMSYPEINEIIYDSELVVLLDSVFNKIRIALVVIAILFFFISILLINSNIQLTIYSKRFIIKTMQLVGATKRFIQAPFLKSSLKTSISAIIIGNISFLLLVNLIMQKIPELSNLITNRDFLYIVIFTSTITIIITLLSTWLCVRKYLNLKTHELYK